MEVDLVDGVDGRCGCAGNAFEDEDEDDDEYEDENIGYWAIGY